MRKVLFIWAMLAMAVIAGAQGVEQLEPKEVNGDAMLGSNRSVIWRSEHVNIVEPEKGSVQIILTKADHIFIKNYETRIGYYTDKDQLIGMGMVLRPTPSQGGTKMEIGVAFANDSLPYSVYSEDEYYVKKSWRILPKDVLKWLKESNGHIRVVTPIYDNNLFDVKFRLKRE
jgi:hypothetical protein